MEGLEYLVGLGFGDDEGLVLEVEGKATVTEQGGILHRGEFLELPRVTVQDVVQSHGDIGATVLDGVGKLLEVEHHALVENLQLMLVHVVDIGADLKLVFGLGDVEWGSHGISFWRI